MIVARGASPVDLLRGFAGDEAAILPKIFARTSAAAAMQAVNHTRRNTARLKNKSRHGVGQLAGADRRLSYRSGLVLRR
jgi:hypothetical protein